MSVPPARSPATASPSDERGPRIWWQSLSRRRRIWIVAVSIVLLLVIGTLLARYLSSENVERNDILMVLRAQARGDWSRELTLIDDCRSRPYCVATVRASALALKRPGEVKLLSIKSTTAGSLTTATGHTRVAWTVIGRLPVVQCVLVRRTGDFLRGFHIALLSLSAPINNEASC